MRKIFFSLIAVFAISALSCNSTAKESVVNINSIPPKAQNFIKENFGDKKILSTVKDSELMDVEYKVYFADGTNINFNSKGEWKEIDGNSNCIPTSTIPANIKNFVTENYPDICICKIEIDKEFISTQYNVELQNRMELKFDKNGSFMGFDD